MRNTLFYALISLWLSPYNAAIVIDNIKQLNPTHLNRHIGPNHVGLIVDGNGRWATKRSLPRLEGHRVGASKAVDVVKKLYELNVQYVTLFLFSSENWSRPKPEIDNIMYLLEKYLHDFSTYLKENKVTLRVIGEQEKLPSHIMKMIHTVGYISDNDDKISSTQQLQLQQQQQQQQQHNKNAINTHNNIHHNSNSNNNNNNNNNDDCNHGKTLCLALSYGGRNDIVTACQSISASVLRGDMKVEDITTDIFASHTQTGKLGIPDPDLIIRTSGEFRLSNFLLYQSAYTEFFSIPKLWPDIEMEDIHTIIQEYSTRDRRYGGLPSSSSPS